MLAEAPEIIWVAGLTDTESVKLAAKFNKVERRLLALQSLRLPCVYVWDDFPGPSTYATLQYALRYAGESGGRLLRFNANDTTVQITAENIGEHTDVSKFALVVF